MSVALHRYRVITEKTKQHKPEIVLRRLAEPRTRLREPPWGSPRPLESSFNHFRFHFRLPTAGSSILSHRGASKTP